MYAYYERICTLYDHITILKFLYNLVFPLQFYIVSCVEPVLKVPVIKY